MSQADLKNETAYEPMKYGTLNTVTTSLSHSIIRSMLVASEDENGDPKRMTQMELSELSGVARSTIAKYCSHGGSGLINPDLATICRIADVFDISPAFLLMSTEDWDGVGQGVTQLASILNDSKFLTATDDVNSCRCASAIEASTMGMRLADALGIKGLGRTSLRNIRSKLQMGKKTKKIKKNILAMTALPPTGKLQHTALLPILSICVILGRHQYIRNKARALASGEIRHQKSSDSS